MKNSELTRIVHGFENNARMQLTRDRRSRGGLGSGKRKVVDSFPDDLAAPKHPEHDAAEIAWQLKVIEMQIAERIRDERQREITIRRLRDGESITSMAGEFRMKTSTAINAVQRAKKHLKLAD